MRKKECNKVKDRKYHYTYLIRDNINNKVYYGVHSTDYDPEDIEQYHSSSKHLNTMIKCLGVDNFTKEVRRIFPDRESANIWETKVLVRMDAANDKRFYNKSNTAGNFYAGGKVGVMDSNGCIFTVDVDDPYIGIHYEYATKGRECQPHVKKLLSELYTGKRSGENNPVHKIGDKKAWRRKVSESLTGKAVGNSNCNWHEGLLKGRGEDAKLRHTVNTKVNSVSVQSYIYKGEVYIKAKDIEDISPSAATRGNMGVVIVKEDKPLVPTIVANGEGYATLKLAAISIGVHPNTISARIRSDIYLDYYYIDPNILILLGEIRDNDFRNFLRTKYSEDIELSKEKEHFSGGLKDDEYKKLFIEQNEYMSDYSFKRIKSDVGSCSRFEVRCPICSDDEYVEAGVCTGIFEAGLPSLLNGNLPCRCGDSKVISIEIYEYEVKRLCEEEGLEYLGLDDKGSRGKKETKIVWKCKDGVIHYDTRLGLFLEDGSRCKCGKNRTPKEDLRKVKLNKKFRERLNEYNKRREASV